MGKSYVVLDLIYTPEEGQECFEGTYSECEKFIQNQGGAHFTYKIVPNVQPIQEPKN